MVKITLVGTNRFCSPKLNNGNVVLKGASIDVDEDIAKHLLGQYNLDKASNKNYIWQKGEVEVAVEEEAGGDMQNEDLTGTEGAKTQKAAVKKTSKKRNTRSKTS